MGDGCDKATVKDARRQAMLEIAREIFMDGGYATASMSAIAARLGGSKGTLYNYFASKDELFRAVIQDQCERQFAAMYAGVKTDSSDLAAGLNLIGRRFAELVLAEDTVRFTRVLIAEACRFPELGRIVYAAGPRVTVIRLADYLQIQVDAGRLRRADPRMAANQFLDLCLAGLYRKRLWNAIAPPDAATIGRNVDAAVATFMAAFGALEPFPA